MGATIRRTTVRLLLAPVLVTLAVCLPKLNQGEFNVDTGWYAAVAHQAWRGALGGDLSWLWSLRGVGGEGGVPYFNKPPAGFWLGGWPLALFGPSLWAARLGSVLAAVMCVVLTTLLVRRASGTRVAFGAGLVLALTVPFVGLARSYSLDLWMTAGLLGALWAVVSFDRRPSSRPVLLGGAALGVALLTKPIVPLLIVPAVVAWAVLVGRRHTAVAALGIAGVGVLVAAPWHVSMILLHGDAFTDQYFGREMAGRAAADPGSTTFNTGATSPLYYLGALAEAYWPWLVTVLLAFAALGLGRVPVGRDRRWLVLGLVWTVVWLVCLSVFADKRPRYLAPLMPVWAWMSALWLTRAGWGAPAVVRRVWGRALVPLVVGTLVVGTMVALAPVRLHRGPDKAWVRLSGWLAANPDATLYQGGFSPQRCAKIYLMTGRWPVPTVDNAGVRIAEPPAGGLVVYHDRDGLARGGNEVVVFEEGRLRVTRVGKGEWRPQVVGDPGE